MSREPEWLTLDDVLEVHRRQLQTFSGAAGLRDRGALESALARPQNKWHMTAADLPDLAAAYAFGMVRNLPFVDGNKRAGFLAMAGFLILNGVDFAPPPDEATAMILALAAGEVGEEGLTRWIRDKCPPA